VGMVGGGLGLRHRTMRLGVMRHCSLPSSSSSKREEEEEVY
jgi:hypothetical protein